MSRDPRSADRYRHRIPRRVAAALTLTFALAACGGNGSGGGSSDYGFPEALQEPDRTINVWVDAQRVSAVEAFQKAQPKVRVKATTYDGSADGSNSFRTKMQVFDKAGSGWPDVVFSTQNNDAAWASQEAGGKQAFAAVLDGGLVADRILDDFTKGSLDPCTVQGKVYCLRNDLAPVVLWYNKSLLGQFGYSLPTTWEEYVALGQKLAKEHPGYIIGAAGDSFTPEVYFWSAKCSANNVTGPTALTVKTTSPECLRVASALDKLREAGTVPNLSVFAPDFVKKYAGKVLLMPGPSWYAGGLFNNPQSLNSPRRQLGVARPLPWAGEEPVTGNVGGGTWFISSHSKNLEGARKFVEFATTSDAFQVALSPGYPAYGPAAKKWVANQEASGYYATPLTALSDAAGEIWTGWGFPAFSQENIWAKTITPAVAGGRTLVDLLPEWETAIKSQALLSGYTAS
jgi:ABC-type glycerol-3-phosphate transport system substrate-binding protein